LFNYPGMGLGETSSRELIFGMKLIQIVPLPPPILPGHTIFRQKRFRRSPITTTIKRR